LELGLPNHSHAASPCLRSRLALGVRASSENLKRIESAEDIVRNTILPEVHNNFRVRHLIGDGARLELDEELMIKSEEMFPLLAEQIAELGYTNVVIKAFRSGSVSAPTGLV
jgi:pyridinium-3,5-biscarboxylic acid mononucleotide sulfurtransferase